MFIQINPQSWCRKKHKIKYFMFQSSGLLNSLIHRLVSSRYVSPDDVSICTGRKWYVCHFLVLSPLTSSFIVNDETVYILYIYCCMIDIFHLKTDYLMVYNIFVFSNRLTPTAPVYMSRLFIDWHKKRQYSFWSTFRWNESNFSASLLII